MTDKDYKNVDKQDLQDEIITILFKYLVAENEEKDRIIAYLKACNKGDINVDNNFIS